MVEDDILKKRIDTWRRKLIDLSKRNRLLNFRKTKVTTIKVIDEIPSEIYDIVVLQNSAMEFLPLDDEEEKSESNTLFNRELSEKESGDKDKIDSPSREFKDYDRENLDEKHIDKYLQTDLTSAQLNKNLLRITSKASSVMEEQGYNVLFISLGILQWYESQFSDTKLEAPLILVPVELIRKSVRGKFKLKYTGEEPILNPALVQKMKIDFDIELEELQEDIGRIEPKDIYKNIKDKISKFKGWKITNDIYISIFSFSKFVMYKDIESNESYLSNNSFIKALCGQGDDVSLPDISELNLEKEFHPLKTFQVLDADSSQQEVILSISKGLHLVIEGPPGTGKSQTIANIIAESITHGKKVLFVSQKMAALEVVEKRLKEVGLEDFCFELHSKKTKKSRVVQELDKVSKMGKEPDHTHDAELEKLTDLRSRLNDYIQAVHEPFGDLKMTPYKAYGILNSNFDVSDVEYIFDDAIKWNRKKFDKCCDLLRNLSNHLQSLGNPCSHSWKGSHITELDYKDKLEFKNDISNYKNFLDDFEHYQTEIAKEMFFKVPSSIIESEHLLEVINLFIDIKDGISTKILKDENWNLLGEDKIVLIEKVKRFNNFKDEIQNKYNLNVLGLDDVLDLRDRFKQYSKSLIFFLKPKYWEDRKKIRNYLLRNKYRPKLKIIVEDLSKINEGQKLTQQIELNDEVGKKLFGKLWKGINTNGNEIEKFSKWIVKFRFYVEKSYFNDTVFKKIEKNEFSRKDLKKNLDILTNKLNKFKNLLSVLIDKSKLNIQESLGKELKEVKYEKIKDKILDMRDSLEDVDLWIKYNTFLSECKKLGILDFILKLINESFPFKKIENIFKCQFLRCWLDYVFKERDILRDFFGENHEHLVDEFRTLDKKQLKLARIRARHILSGKLDQNWQTSKNSELGIVRRQARKQRAHIPTRKLFHRIPNLLLDLKPCLMMSPMTVAQFLDPELFKFDVVIFDEASQMPVEDSLGAIMRGKQIVVAGDEKQLPPTSFFQSEVFTSDDSEEDFDELLYEDLESILKEAAGTSLIPSKMLKWHYRSLHESLITFSNRNFYNNKLYTFPNKDEDSPKLGVGFNYISDGVYDRGRSRANRKEARRVMEAAFEHFRNCPELTLGVGTFSAAQKYAIEDVKEEMLRKDNSLESFFVPDKLEHFFIKNLEIIQGDERDVIFISVGYGKDENGKLSMNFGPINKKGGKRRLNVLVTRARRRVEIFSSIKGSDFNLSRIKNDGVHLFKRYLDYAEKGRVALKSETCESFDEFSESLFEESVYEILKDEGIPVRRQVGCSGYRIDLAVVNEEKPGEYILGIECDGASYHSSKTSRDRDRLRQQILESLGWNIYRIWSTDWFKNPKREHKKLFEAIDRAKLYTKKKIRNEEKFSINLKYDFSDIENSSQGKQTNLIKDYVVTPIKQDSYKEAFYQEDINEIAEVLTNIVSCESPIHRDEAIRRAIKYWGISSTGSEILRIFTLAENYCRKKNKFKVKNDFYWSRDMGKPTVRCRINSSISKDIKLIAPEEIAEGFKEVLRREYSMPEEDLIKQTLRLLGYRRTTESIYEYMKECLEKYLDKNEFLKVKGRITINSDSR